MKKLFSIFLAAVLVMTSAQAFAKSNTATSTYALLKNKLLENNLTIKNLNNSVRQAQISYTDTVAMFGSINTKGVTFTFNNEEHFFAYDDYTQMLMTKQKELLPKQAKYQWESAIDNTTVSSLRLTLGLRDLYGALLGADVQVKIKNEILKVEQSKYDEALKKYSTGLISENNRDEAEYSCLSAKSELQIAQRNKENACRSINSYIGTPIECVYESIVIDEVHNPLKLSPVETYIEKALKERLEITDLLYQKSLKELNLEILNTKDVYEKNKDTDEDLKKEHDTLIDEIEKLKIDIEKSKIEIELEIRNAYADLVKEEKSLIALENSLKEQKSKVKKYSQSFSQGKITKTTLAEIRLSVFQMEYSVKLGIYNLNTKLMKFEKACALGPGY
ncbi:MAG: TolC family protein [Clostridia bacterium]|nr:TolC family protein [Clostridia bacterium]